MKRQLPKATMKRQLPKTTMIKVSIKTLMYKHKYILKDNKFSSDNKQNFNLLFK
jgi:hypothetical protein